MIMVLALLAICSETLVRKLASLRKKFRANPQLHESTREVSCTFVPYLKEAKNRKPRFGQRNHFSIAVHGLNNTANPEGLIPKLLVFGCMPKIPLSNLKHLCPTQRERFAARESARR